MSLVKERHVVMGCFSNQKLTEWPHIARDPRLEMLHLGRNQLADVRDLSLLTSLRHLGLGQNKFKQFPVALLELAQLEHLDLARNELAQLPDDIASLGNLQVLYVSYNKLTRLTALGRSLSLRELRAKRNQITQLPAAVCGLLRLQILDLAKNQLSTMPDEIGKLTALQHLILCGNLIAVVPATIGSLINMKYLDLSNNKIGTIPDEIGNLTALEHLDLSSNKIGTIPKSLGNLTKLVLLDLSSNKIGAIPDEIGNLTALEHLDLSNNEIGTIPEGLGNLTKLEHLDLSINQIGVIGEGLGAGLAALVHLDLHRNFITAANLSPKFFAGSSLRVVNLNGNPLGGLPRNITDALGQHIGMRKLDLGSCSLEIVPAVVTQLTNLEHLELGDNYFRTLLITLLRLTRLKSGSCMNQQLERWSLMPAAASLTSWPNTFAALLTKAANLVVYGDVILVGEPGSGKQALVQLLSGLPPPPPAAGRGFWPLARTPRPAPRFVDFAACDELLQSGRTKVFCVLFNMQLVTKRPDEAQRKPWSTYFDHQLVLLRDCLPDDFSGKVALIGTHCDKLSEARRNNIMLHIQQRYDEMRRNVLPISGAPQLPVVTWADLFCIGSAGSLDLPRLEEYLRLNGSASTRTRLANLSRCTLIPAADVVAPTHAGLPPAVTTTTTTTTTPTTTTSTATAA